MLAEELRSTPFDAVYSSDLSRAYETAEIVAAAHGVPVVTDACLREIDIGSWSGLTKSEIQGRFAGERVDGETRDQHAARVLDAVERIARRHSGERILIVTHGGTMRALRAHVEDEPFHPVENCGVLELHFRDDRLTSPI
jgi:broad specificity phosphatase PhoE